MGFARRLVIRVDVHIVARSGRVWCCLAGFEVRGLVFVDCT